MRPAYPAEPRIPRVIAFVVGMTQERPTFARDVAVQKIPARLGGAKMASEELGV